MKKIISSILIVVLCQTLSAQWYYFSIGATAGADMTLGQKGANVTPGFAGTIDFGISYFWRTGNSLSTGIASGVSAGYAMSGYNMSLNDSFTNVDYEGYPVQYTVTAKKVSLSNRQIQLQVPLLFALKSNGFTANLGVEYRLCPKVSYRQTIKEPVIAAYYEDVDVTMVNNMLTGVLSPTDCNSKGTYDGIQQHLLATCAFGYEWSTLDGNIFGLALKADVSILSFGMPSKQSYNHLVEVSSISNPNNPPAQVKVNPLSAFVNGNGTNLALGLSVYYCFGMQDRNALGLHKYPSNGHRIY